MQVLTASNGIVYLYLYSLVVGYNTYDIFKLSIEIVSERKVAQQVVEDVLFFCRQYQMLF